ncbi:MAG: competence/damage-inducible protein A [Candidatus Omnitrophica bacterium]|nr:competence/damage-inducible protein A [Candidatus Omnitrophota bacterium]
MLSMRAEIISVGTELLLGHIVNTNASFLSKRLASLGIDVYHHITVGDNPIRLADALNEALTRSGIIITTGGLGPTVDDITLRTIGSAMSRAMVFEKKIAKYIKLYFKKSNIRKIPKDALRQAYVPRGALWFENKVGTAPAILIPHGKKIIVSLPGPPRELVPLFEKSIIPYLRKKGFAGNWIIKTRTIKISGFAEVDVNNAVKDLLSMGPYTTLGIYAHLGEAHLKITSKAKNEKTADREIKKVEAIIRKRLGNYVYGADNETLESVVGEMLTKKKLICAVAESCTGGLISNMFTNVSGSSKYFKMGIIAYSNTAKVELLGVPEEKIEKYGAVSKEVALSMAEGIKKVSGADISLATTGIAGPTGGTTKKPVGLVYIAAIGYKLKMVKKYRFSGNREEIKLQTSISALNLIRAVL